MNAVGIDVSKGKSMVCVMRPFGEVVLEPFEVLHTAQSLNDLAGKLKALDGETRVVLEATGNYHKSVAFVLHDAGLFISVVNPVLIHDYDNNSLRRVKTDRKDAVKIANYTLDKWRRLRQYLPEDDTRLALKNCYRQYQQNEIVLPFGTVQHLFQHFSRFILFTNATSSPASSMFAGIRSTPSAWCRMPSPGWMDWSFIAFCIRVDSVVGSSSDCC